ncbi:MAG: CoB--CoM heterodisulfide reductase iron-sulfur subunit A family protein [Dehalococcoidales bacterium]|nr:MAG: CoB--CoM heterodisulfide reductase iron-sulfur subunit A family protein [Dehalococcoidales bacterium]
MARQERIGVFVCHCGNNIAGTVDIERVVEELSHYPGVVHVEDYMYMCSDPGQELMRKAIQEKALTGIVNANCSPTLHQRTFRRVAEAEGLNPYCVEIANIREQCSWPHADDKETATRKAIAIIKATVEKLRFNMALTPTVTPLTKRVLVIGAGIAGIQAALDIANGGYGVVLVEQDIGIGGHVMQLAGTFPSLEQPDSLIASRLAEVASHPLVKLYTYAEVEEVSGYVGNFDVKIRQKAGYINRGRCNACGMCLEKCPVLVSSEYDCGLSQRKAIRLPSPAALTFHPVIDVEHCLHFNGSQCQACCEVCPEGAIDFSEEDTFVEERIGVVVAAPGYDLLPVGQPEAYPEDPDIIDGLKFERILSATGPTNGEIRRPSDGKVPREVVFISCVGSRDPEHGVPYCSRVCCMYVAKQALLYRQAVPEGQAYIFYMDIRSDAKGFEEFVQDVMDEGGILYLRGEVSRMFRDGDKIKVWGVDTLIGRNIEISADLVVLARAMVPRPTTRELTRKLNIASDAHGFLTEAHIKLRPVESLTSGIYLAGTAQWPRDLPDTIASAEAAASKVLSLFSREELLHEPTIAWVDEEICSGCEQCVANCTYKAIEVDKRSNVARVNEAICEGCGSCAAICPSNAVQLKNSTPRQFFEIIDVAAG